MIREKEAREFDSQENLTLQLLLLFLKNQWVLKLSDKIFEGEIHKNST